MRTYYQRELKCTKCNESLRETVYNLPLNKTGRLMEQMWERQFRNEHAICKTTYFYSDWRLISDRDYKNENLQRKRV